jgi:hypothetical protein
MDVTSGSEAEIVESEVESVESEVESVEPEVESVASEIESVAAAPEEEGAQERIVVDRMLSSHIPSYLPILTNNNRNLRRASGRSSKANSADFRLRLPQSHQCRPSTCPPTPKARRHVARHSTP